MDANQVADVISKVFPATVQAIKDEEKKTNTPQVTSPSRGGLQTDSKCRSVAYGIPAIRV